MKYVWKGPPTAGEVWPEPESGDKPAAAPLFSGPLAPGQPIPADLPANHPQITSWLAFGLIEAMPEPIGTANDRRAKEKDPANG